MVKVHNLKYYFIIIILYIMYYYIILFHLPHSKNPKLPTLTDKIIYTPWLSILTYGKSKQIMKNPLT